MAQTQAAQAGTIAAFFENSDDARDAVEELKEAGFTSAQLGVAHWDSSTSESYEEPARRSSETGEVSTWDKIKAWFTGEDASTTKRTDDSSGYHDTSDLHGSFTTLDISEDSSRYFSHRLNGSTEGAVVTVRAGERRAEAEAILADYDGDFGESAANYDYAGQTGDYAEAAREETPERIQLLGEVLRVHKDRIDRGEVRIRKEVVTENQNLEIPVEREELVVERNPVTESRPASGTIGEKEIRVPLSEEKPVVDKSTVVREEVSVKKKPVEEIRNVNADVKREELVVDDESEKRRRSA